MITPRRDALLDIPESGDRIITDRITTSHLFFFRYGFTSILGNTKNVAKAVTRSTITTYMNRSSTFIPTLLNSLNTGRIACILPFPVPRFGVRLRG